MNELHASARFKAATASRSSSGRGNPPINGQVVELSRAVDVDARAFLVKIALPDAPGMRSGEFGKARFGGTPRRALTVPSAAIVRRGQLTSVFVVDGDVARVRLVSLGESSLAGLTQSGGDSCVAALRRRRAECRVAVEAGEMAATNGAAGRMAAAFIHSKLTPLFILASMALGALAVVALPREE